MRKGIFYRCVNEFETYLFIPQMVLHCLLWIQREIRLSFHIVHKGNMHFGGEIKEMSKNKKLPARKQIALELLHHILGHISTRSLLTGDTDNVWEDIELRIDPDPIFTSCQISSMNKKAKS